MRIVKKGICILITFSSFAAIYIIFVLYIGEASVKKLDMKWIFQSSSEIHFQHTLPSVVEKPYLNPLSSRQRDIIRKQLRVNLNRASVDELVDLPGIGPVLATRIIAKREQIGAFRHRGDLLETNGIGVKKLERLRDYITFGDIEGE